MDGFMSKFVDLTGKTFGKLTILRRSGTQGKGRRSTSVWHCVCICGKEEEFSTSNITDIKYPACSQCKKDDISIRARDRVKRPNLPMSDYYSSYKRNSQNRKIEWDISPHLFLLLTSQNCIYCGQKPSRKVRDKYGDRELYVSGLDRVDNRRGYLPDNVVPCCKICNYAKKAYSLPEFLEWVSNVFHISISTGAIWG